MIRPLLERITPPTLLVSAVPIYFRRTSAINDERLSINVKETRNAGGSLFNLRLAATKHWFAEVTTGLETDSARFAGTTQLYASRTGFDDVVFEAGYRHFFGQNIQCILYALGGIPTRRKVTLDDRFGPLVGTRFYNIGLGFEGSYSLISELEHSLSTILQTRFIHAFDRRWTPVLPPEATIKPGNFTDILFLVQYRKKRTVFETGYDATIFSQQGTNLPDEKIRIPTFGRHSWFASVKHGIFQTWIGKLFVFGAGLNVSKTKRFDAKTVSAWVFGTIVF